MVGGSECAGEGFESLGHSWHGSGMQPLVRSTPQVRKDTLTVATTLFRSTRTQLETPVDLWIALKINRQSVRGDIVDLKALF